MTWIPRKGKEGKKKAGRARHVVCAVRRGEEATGGGGGERGGSRGSATYSWKQGKTGLQNVTSASRGRGEGGGGGGGTTSQHQYCRFLVDLLAKAVIEGEREGKK